jgi:aminopeptidase N
MKKTHLLATALCLSFISLKENASAQLTSQQKAYTRADTLRGSISEDRAWWDVVHYDISVRPLYNDKSLFGEVAITFRVLGPGRRMQLDLQQPLEVLSVDWRGRRLPFTRSGNLFHVDFPEAPATGSLQTVRVRYGGKPTVAVRPPWDGGWIFSRDRTGSPWMSVACQGLGASVWYPCKDHQSDEPDSARMNITVPDTLQAVANGRLRGTWPASPGERTWSWAVTNPINSYNLVPYIGKYASWSETYAGEAGPLDCSYYVLEGNLAAAKQQFRQVPSMLKCFEHWFGPYPFYADGYKLVESPHLGMEHQSAIAYGNGFQNGYRGRDLSQSGWGLKWDFIIVHESGHEWFGNNITSNDLGDMWIHEGFTNYSETVYTECLSGRKAGSEYSRGTRALIKNDIPVVGPYGVNDEGSGDMYYKGGNTIHYMRQLFRNDEKFRMALRAMNDSFRHRTVDYADVVRYWSRASGMDLAPLFTQYLKTTQIPTLAYRVRGKKLEYRWTDCIPGYDIPVEVVLDGGQRLWLNPTTKSKSVALPAATKEVSIAPDFYAMARGE